MRRYEVYLLVMALLISLFNTALVLLNERRVDAYISIAILIYFIVTAILGTALEFHVHTCRLLSLALILLFLAIVAYRIWKVLHPGPHPLDVVFGG